jgi:hypothetical protein
MIVSGTLPAFYDATNQSGELNPMTNDTSHVGTPTSDGDSGAEDIHNAHGLVGASVSGHEDVMLDGEGVAAGDSSAEYRIPRSGRTSARVENDADDGIIEDPADDSPTGDDISASNATGSGMAGNPG